MLQETVWLYDTPIAVIKQNQTYAIHTDHLNTPRLITDSSNQTVWAWPNAEAFGDTPANQNPQGLGVFEYHLRYPGQLYDTETKTHYNYFRDNYAPDSGRYKQSDPIGLAGGINTYLYVGGNPVRYVDEKGRLAHVVAGALAGGLFGALGSGFQSWTQGNGFFNLEALANGFVGGTIGGAFAASGFYFAGGALSSGITDALDQSSALNQLSNQGTCSFNDIDPYQVALSAALGATLGGGAGHAFGSSPLEAGIAQGVGIGGGAALGNFIYFFKGL